MNCDEFKGQWSQFKEEFKRKNSRRSGRVYRRRADADRDAMPTKDDFRRIMPAMEGIRPLIEGTRWVRIERSRGGP